MQITIKTIDMTLTPSMATYVQKKLANIEQRVRRYEKGGEKANLGKVHDPVLARVELIHSTRHHRKGEVFRAQITIHIPRQGSLHAEADAEDLHVAVDRVRDELLGELRSLKERQMAMIKKGGRELKRRIHREDTV